MHTLGVALASTAVLLLSVVVLGLSLNYYLGSRQGRNGR